uniref:Uncharacterized protein n=1 Tax=Anguilla anguilla TaxID=7936 RepID=A0A0E9T669_ANGAN
MVCKYSERPLQVMGSRHHPAVVLNYSTVTLVLFFPIHSG